jgi:hypothetical protein
VNISSGKDDWSASYPWRSPGAAPVFGSGCGIAGGNSVGKNKSLLKKFFLTIFD